MQVPLEYKSGALVLNKPAWSVPVQYSVIFIQQFSGGTTKLHQSIHCESTGKSVESLQCDRSLQECVLALTNKKVRGIIFKQFM